MLIEIAAFSVDAALEAEKAGANRIELCSAPSEGGLTPSLGTLSVVKQMVNIHVFVMIRPREGDFCYSDAEFSSMLLDVELARKAGANGIVTGLLNKEGTIDTQRLKRILQVTNGMEVTFHRAFDMVKDPGKSIKILADLGINRVLTSGGKRTAAEGHENIRNLILQANNKIIVLPAGNINQFNVNELVKNTDVSEIHLSAKKLFQSEMEFRNPEVTMGISNSVPEYFHIMPDHEVISAIRNQFPE